MSIIEDTDRQLSHAIWQVIGRGAMLILRKSVLFATNDTAGWLGMVEGGDVSA